ncbi:MAG TPA: phage holin family protein [Patescibacteria group bacterium]|nr:phage holin family protein [Patescibacteria group bacterium]
MNLLIKWLLSTAAVMIASFILPGVRVDGFWTAAVVAILLGVANMFIKPVLVLLSLPITILTLGLFMFILNGIIVLLVSAIVPGFKVDGLLWAIIFSIVVSLVGAFLGSLL